MVSNNKQDEGGAEKEKGVCSANVEGVARVLGPMMVLIRSMERGGILQGHY